MFAVNKGDISITKGDRASIEFRFSGEVPAASTVVKFIVGTVPVGQSPVFSKSSTVTSTGSVAFTVTGTDTGIAPGIYQYWARIQKTDGYDTVASGKFEIREAVV